MTQAGLLSNLLTHSVHFNEVFRRKDLCEVKEEEEAAEAAVEEGRAWMFCSRRAFTDCGVLQQKHVLNNFD